jgi:hypothetical protein
VHAAHLFVVALGASSYTHAEARWMETLPDWIGAHVNALDFLGGVMKAAVLPWLRLAASNNPRAANVPHAFAGQSCTSQRRMAPRR